MNDSKNIKTFYEVDGIDYSFRRWQKNPVAQFDYRCTKTAITKFLGKLHFKSALEVGCGSGTWTPLLKHHSEKVTAVDISETMLKQAEQRNNHPDIKFIRADIMELQTAEKFDLIFSIRALEYIENKEQFFEKCFQWLNPGGRIFIITKTKVSYWYGRTKTRKWLKKMCPFLFNYENRTLKKRTLDNIGHFWQDRLSVKKFILLSKKAGIGNLTVIPVIIRPPIFMRGKSEVPLIPPFLEKPILTIFSIVDIIFSKIPYFTFFAESYLVIGKKQ